MDNKVLYCMSCGAALNVELNRPFVYCMYCGAKNIIESQQMRTDITVGNVRVKAQTSLESMLASAQYAFQAEQYDKANEILKEITEGGITFEDAARKYSSCPSSQQGGSLGEFGRGQMVPEFDQACFDMETGEVRGPIKTRFGYHLIRLDGKGEGKPVSFNEAAEQIKQILLTEKRQKAYQSRVNQLKILYPVERP